MGLARIFVLFSPVDLKLPHRVKAPGHVMLLSLLVYSLFERSARQGLKKENEL